MARARNIKPSFFDNEHLAECSAHARLLFIGLWVLADREGRLEDRPKKIKAQLFPYEEIDCERLLCELAGGGFIKRYESTDVKAIWIPTFVKHQRPHPNELASTLPAFSESLVKKPGRSRKITNQSGKKTASCALPSSSLNPSSLNAESPLSESPILNSSSHEELSSRKERDRHAPTVQAVVAHYQGYHPKARPGAKERKLVRERIIQEGYSQEDLCKAIDGNHISPWHCGQNPDGTEYHKFSLIFRDSAQVASFIEHAEKPPPQNLSEKTRRSQSAIEGYLNRVAAQQVSDV